MRGLRGFLISWSLVLIAVILLTSRDVAFTSQQVLPAGTWGGEHIAMTVDGEGAQIEFDCAVGDISSPIILDADGRFSIRGTYRAESPAPVNEGGGGNAVYTGTLKGDKLQLGIAIDGRSEPLSFELTHNQPGKLAKCA